MTSTSDPGRAELLTDPARVVIGTLLYTGKFEQLDEALVDRRAHALIEEPLDELTAADEYSAIAEALSSDAQLTRVIELPDFITDQHTEHNFRGFLRRLLDRLDAMRPWPEPPHRELSYTRWLNYKNARVMGRVKMLGVNAEGRLRYSFSSVRDDCGSTLYVLVLRLHSGDEVALVTPWWPDSSDSAVLSRNPHRSPDDVMAGLVDGTGLTPDQVTVLGGDLASWPEA